MPEYCPAPSTEYDGLILCGGNDISPSYYDEEIMGAVNIDSERDAAEFQLLKAFVEKKKPVLGICRGYQLINVFFGGTLCQDLPNTEEHRQSTEYYMVHNVRAEKDSLLYNMYGETFSVNSCHHQAVKEVGDGLCVIATAGDIVEGIVHSNLPILGVQWHPEKMCCQEKREDAVDGAEIFRYFIELCKK